MRDWLVRNAVTDHEGTETVNGRESNLWDTELEGYLSTDTHNGHTDEGYWGGGPYAAGNGDPQARSDSEDVFIGDCASNNSNYYYSPASLSATMSKEHTDPAPTHAGPFHTSPQPPDDDQKPAATDTSTLKPAAEPATADSNAPNDDGNAPLS